MIEKTKIFSTKLIAQFPRSFFEKDKKSSIHNYSQNLENIQYFIKWNRARFALSKTGRLKIEHSRAVEIQKTAKMNVHNFIKSEKIRVTKSCLLFQHISFIMVLEINRVKFNFKTQQIKQMYPPALASF